MEKLTAWFNQRVWKSNHEKAIQDYSLGENIQRLKIIATVGSLVNIGITWISLFDQYALVFVEQELHLRLIWIALSIIYLCCATKNSKKWFGKFAKVFMYLTISVSLVLAALISSLPFADHSYVIVYLANILLIGTLLYLSDLEMIFVSAPSLMVLTVIYLVYPNGVLHQGGQLINVVSITIFAFMMAHINYSAKATQWNATNIIERKNRELHTLSTQDELTGISNRRCINETLERMIDKCDQSDDALGILMIDIDYFKRYNDSKGHLRGDQCLVEVVTLLRAMIHEPQEFIGRFGGEEFLILLPRSSQSKVMEKAEQICQSISSCGIEHKQSPYGHVTVSIGAFVQKGGADVPAIMFLESADAALYEAKSQGRNRAVMFSH